MMSAEIAFGLDVADHLTELSNTNRNVIKQATANSISLSLSLSLSLYPMDLSLDLFTFSSLIFVFFAPQNKHDNC